MIFITDEEIENLPNEPEQAFVTLESIVRERYEAAYAELDDSESPIPLLRRYMSIVLPAAQHYEIQGLAGWERPGSQDWDAYNAFIADVDFCTAGLRLRSIERQKQYSVALDRAARLKLRHLLDQVRNTVEKLDVSVAKKERLYSRINALRDEIDRKRTRYQAFAALAIEACDDAGEAAKRLEPVVQLMERVGAALGIAKRAEDSQPRLPQRQEPKRIGSSKKHTARLSSEPTFESMDDEIPF